MLQFEISTGAQLEQLEQIRTLQSAPLHSPIGGAEQLEQRSKALQFEPEQNWSKTMPKPEDCATLQAIFDGVDNARAEVEREWGFERLALLVDDDWRAKLYRQKEKWSRAYQAAWEADLLTADLLVDVQTQAGGMKRAWAKLAEVATEAGHRPVAPWVWETSLADGSVCAIVQTDAEAERVISDGRYVQVWTLREVANVIDAGVPQSLQTAKRVWPGAKFTGLRDKSWVKDGDEIPF